MNVCCPTLGKLTRIFAPWSNPHPLPALPLHGVYIDRCITLDVEGRTFAAHRCVLAASSKFFNGLFTNDMKEKSAPVVKFEGIPASVMDQLLSYLYAGEIQVSEANAEDLIVSANYLLLPRLKNIACKFIERHMTSSNCIFNYLFAEKYECNDLQSYARKLIKQNFGTVGRSKEFSLLSFDHVKDLISRDDIVIMHQSIPAAPMPPPPPS